MGSRGSSYLDSSPRDDLDQAILPFTDHCTTNSPASDNCDIRIFLQANDRYGDHTMSAEEIDHGPATDNYVCGMDRVMKQSPPSRLDQMARSDGTNTSIELTQ